MERILKSLLDHLLRDYVTFSKELGDGAFRASFSSTGILLHDIEFNVEKLKSIFPGVKSAWAQTLEIKVPWSMLGTTSKSLEVHVSSIRLVMTKNPQEVAGCSKDDRAGCLHSNKSAHLDDGKENPNLLYQRGLRSGVYSGLVGYLLEMSVFLADIQITYEFDQANIASFSIDWIEVTSSGIDTFNDVVVNPSDWIDKEVLMNGIKFAWAIQAETALEMRLTHANLNMVMPKSLILRSEEHLRHLILPVAISLGDVWCEANISQFWPIMQVMLSQKTEDPDRNIWSKLIYSLSLFFKNDSIKEPPDAHTLEGGMSQADDSSWKLEIGITLSVLCLRAHMSNEPSFRCFSFEASLIAANIEVDHCGGCDASLWIEGISLGQISCDRSELGKGNAPFLNISPANIDDEKNDLKKMHGFMLHLVWSMKEISLQIDSTLGRLHCINTLLGFDNFANSVRMLLDECPKEAHVMLHSSKERRTSRPYKLSCTIQESLVGITCEESQVLVWVQGSRIEVSVCMDNHSKIHFNSFGELSLFLEERDLAEQCNALKLSSTKFHLHGSNEAFVVSSGTVRIKLNNVQITKVINALVQWNNKHACLAFRGLENFELNLDSLETNGSKLLIYDEGEFTLGISASILLHLKSYSCKMSVEANVSWVPTKRVHVSAWMLNLLVIKSGESRIGCSDIMQGSCSSFAIDYRLEEEFNAMIVTIGSVVLQSQLSSMPQFTEAIVAATSPFCSLIAQKNDSITLQKRDISSLTELYEFNLDFVSISFVGICPKVEQMLHVWVSCVQGSNHLFSNSSDIFIVEVYNLGIESEMKNSDLVCYTNSFLRLDSNAHRGAIVVHTKENMHENMISSSVSIEPFNLHFSSHWNGLLFETLHAIKDAQDFLSLLLENGQLKRSAVQNRSLKMRCQVITIELSDLKENTIVGKFHLVTCGIANKGICHGRPWLDDSLWLLMDMRVLLEYSSCSLSLRSADLGQFEKIASASSLSFSFLKWPLGEFKSVELNCIVMYIHGSIGTWKSVLDVIMNQKIQVHNRKWMLHEQPEISYTISDIDDIRGHPTIKDLSCSFEDFMAIRAIQGNNSDQQIIWWRYYAPRLVHSIRLQFPVGIDIQTGANISLQYSCDGVIEIIDGKLGSNGELLLSEKPASCSCDWGIEWNSQELPFCAAEVLNMLFVKSNFRQIPKAACRNSDCYAEIAADTCFKIRMKHVSIDLVALGWPEGPRPGIINHNLMKVLLGVKASDIILSAEVSNCLALSISCSINGDITDPITFRPYEFFSGESLCVEYVQWQDRNSIDIVPSSQFANRITNSLTRTENLDKYRASEEATFHQVSVHSREDVLMTFSDSLLLVGQQWMSMLMSDSFNRYPVTIKNTCGLKLIMREKNGNKEVTVIDSEQERGVILEQSKSLLFRPESSLEWSHPIQVLSCHAELLEIGQHRLAAEVRFCEGSFLLKICRGIVVVNQTCNLLHLCITSNGNKSKVKLDPGSEWGSQYVEMSLSVETEAGWTQQIELREQLLSPRRDDIKELKEHGSDFALLLGVKKCSKSGKVVANIYPPVSLTNRLSQSLLLKDLRGQLLRLQSGSSVDLPLPSYGGQVVKVGICDEISCDEEGFIGLVCPPYGGADDFSRQMEEKNCAYVPPPGQSVEIRIPQASNLQDINVLLVCQLQEYGTLSLELCPRVTLYNRTNLYLHFKVDQEEYILLPSSQLGVSSKANIVSCRCEGDIADRKFPSFVWKGCDASFSQESVIDFVSSDLKSLRLYLQIERSPSGVSIEIKPFYYISNDTDYIFHDDYNSYKGNKPIPLLGVMETETNRIRLARTKRRSTGGFLTIDYVMLDGGGIHTPETGITGDFTYSSVVKPSHVHFIFRRVNRSFEIMNKTEENFTLSFADSAENLLRTIYLPKRQCHSIQMYGIETTFQVTVKDASISFPISELRQGCAFPVHTKYMLHMMSKTSCAFVSTGLFHSRVENLVLELPPIVIECSSNSGSNTVRTRIGSTTINGSLSCLCQNLAVNLRMTDWCTSIHSSSESKLLGKSKEKAFFEISAQMIVEKQALVAQWINIILSETHFNLDDTVVRYVIDLLRLFPRDEKASPGLKEELLQELSELQESKFLVEKFTMDPVRATCDIHLSDSFSLPLSIDANRAPISLPAISCERETSWREIIRIFETNAYDGLVVSIPSAIGSLQLLFDPLGLVRSLRRGLFDMVHLPLLGIQGKSLSHFIVGLHQGSASLLKELSGWSVSSITGFSTALMNIVSNSQSSSQHPISIDGGTYETGYGRKLMYGSHLLPNSIFQFCSRNEILLYRDLIEAKVSIRREMDLAFRIEDPVIILLEEYVVVLANCGCIASFLIALDDTEWDLDPLTRRLSMKTRGCYSFADISCAKTAYVELLFDSINFDLFRLTFEELHNHKNRM